MGGIQVIFTGDFFQLPPVQNSTCSPWDPSQDKENVAPRNTLLNQKSNIRKIRKYCFESPIWNSLFPEKSQSCFVLTEIYRQHEQHFVSLLESVRWGEPSGEVLEDLNHHSVGREIDCQDGILPTQICTHR
jgi:ATP-dependent DNA helicase PIF1